MKCKHGNNTHHSTQDWVKCILDTEYGAYPTGLYNIKGKNICRYFYKGTEYSWEEILRICELKAFL